MVFNESIAKLLILSTLIFGVVANVLGIFSCDLLEYRDPSGKIGTLGLYTYGAVDMDNGTADCQHYSDEIVDEATFRTARLGGSLALGLALVLIILHVMHYSVCSIPCKDTFFYLVGAALQVSLAMVSTIRENDLCEAFGCQLGMGASWTGLAHMLYLVATILSLFVGGPTSSTETSRELRTGLLSSSRN